MSAAPVGTTPLRGSRHAMPGGLVEDSTSRRFEELDTRLLGEVLAYLSDFPRLAAVSRRWAEFVRSDTLYAQILAGHCDADGSRWPCQSARSAESGSERHRWELAYGHVAWRDSELAHVVDFATAGISNLANDEGALSQIYYTYPRVGLQFKRKFAVYGIQACTNLERIALKKGAHLHCPPCVQDAAYLFTGQARNRIIKLDFTSTMPSVACECIRCSEASETDSLQRAVTSVVVWTEQAVELFCWQPTGCLSQEERRAKYHLQPVQRGTTLDTSEVLSHSAILIMHINEDNLISILHSDSNSGRGGKLSVFQFDGSEGRYLFTTDVPGPVRSADGSEKGEWKSRERFEFKGSRKLGALIDDDGLVHVFHFDTRTWKTLRATWWMRWQRVPGHEEYGHGPKPKYLRAAGNTVAVWNCGEQRPLYFEVWRVRPHPSVSGPEQPLVASRILCECYRTISSVHVDETRCFVHISRENKDVVVDVWDISKGCFISRVHALNNAWSGEKENVKTYLSRLFWSSPDSVIYYELNTNQALSRNVLSFRQLSALPRQAYLDTCRELRGGASARWEMHRIVTPQRFLRLVPADAIAAISEAHAQLPPWCETYFGTDSDGEIE
eukprot:Hpha_TRINITY_DN3206_c0_g1::TRINITY_DN3206_c0_g1_i1::g.186008::m.186008